MIFYQNLLAMRWLLLNIAIGVLIWLAWRFGLIEAAWIGDRTWITTAILGCLGAGWFLCTVRVARCVRDLDAVKDIEMKRRILPMLLRSGMYIRYPVSDNNRDALKSHLDSRLKPLEWLAYVMVLLGFFGTVWGIGLALEEVARHEVGDASAAAAIVQAMVGGFSVALWTTKTGIACYLALSFNVRLLERGYDRLYEEIVGD